MRFGRPHARSSALRTLSTMPRKQASPPGRRRIGLWARQARPRQTYFTSFAAPSTLVNRTVTLRRPRNPDLRERAYLVLTRAWFLKMVRRTGELARLPFPAHPHMPRHACGFKLANDCVDTRALQHYLGHRTISHTVRYTELRSDPFRLGSGRIDLPRTLHGHLGSRSRSQRHSQLRRMKDYG